MIVRTEDGTSIYFDCFPAKESRGSLLVVHGLGEHSGRYGEVIAEAHRLHLDVHLLDLRGHGRSSGTRGHFRSLEELHADMDAWMKHLVEAGSLKGNLPCFLLGHSFGGLVAVTFAARYAPGPLYPALTGLVLSSPALGMKWSPMRFAEAQLARRLPKFLQSLHVPTGLPYDNLTHDPEEQAAFLRDPLVHRWVTPAGYLAIERGIALLPKLIPQLNLPMLFLVGRKDRVVSVDAALEFARKCSVAHPGRVEVKVFHNFFHEPFHELKRERAFLELKKWILQCLPRKLTPSKKSSSKSSASEATAKATSPSPRARSPRSIST